MRRVLLVLAAAAALAAPAALAQRPFPATIPLPNGFQPEGIATGAGTTFYVGSIPNGAVWAGDLRTGTGRILVKGKTGRAATGLDYDRGRLWVSGASTGKAFVYDARTGRLLRSYRLARGSDPTFVNDVVVTRRAAFFTDSSRPVLYRIELSPQGKPRGLSTIPLGGDYQHVDGFNLNGIDATAGGKTLLSVQTATGKLFAIEPETGVAHAVDLGAATLTNGDGMLLHGRRLYVVRNQANEIAVVRLAENLSSGSLVSTITSPRFDVPTTIARHGDFLYAVNARFNTPPGPDVPYTVVRVRR